MAKSAGIAQVIGVRAGNAYSKANPHLPCVDRLPAFHTQRQRQQVSEAAGNVGMSSDAFASELTGRRTYRFYKLTSFKRSTARRTEVAIGPHSHNRGSLQFRHRALACEKTTMRHSPLDFLDVVIADHHGDITQIWRDLVRSAASHRPETFRLIPRDCQCGP
jgi:hypothetical protein